MREIDEITNIMMELTTHEYPSDADIEPAILDKFEKVNKFWGEVTKYNPEEMYWKNIDTIVSREHDYRKNDEALGRLGRIIG